MRGAQQGHAETVDITFSYFTVFAVLTLTDRTEEKGEPRRIFTQSIRDTSMELISDAHLLM